MQNKGKLPITNSIDLESAKMKSELEVTTSQRETLEVSVRKLETNLTQSEEQLSFTKEDLMGMLLQRADFVAQREEIEEMCEGVRRTGITCNNLRERNIHENKGFERKQRKFYIEIISQLRVFVANSSIQGEASRDYNTIHSLLKRFKKGEVPLSEIDDEICLVAKGVGLTLNREVLSLRKEQQVGKKSHKSDKRGGKSKGNLISIRCPYF